MKTKLTAIVLGFLALLFAGCSTTASSSSSYTGPSIESKLIGKNVEEVVRRFGSPGLVNEVGNTIFVRYTVPAFILRGYQNVCTIEIQATKASKIVENVKLGSNRGIDSIISRGMFSEPLIVRNECERLLNRAWG